MKSLVCVGFLAVLAAIQCAGVPAQDEHIVGRERRSSPWDFFNAKKDTKKVDKKKLKPVPTTHATTIPTTTVRTTTTLSASVMTVKNEMPEHIAEKMGKLKTQDQIRNFLGITGSMSQKITASKKSLQSLGASGQSSGSSDANSEWTTSTACLPRPQVIRFPQPDLYHGVIYPFCAMALRCGGCCLVNMHECVPDRVQNIIHLAFYVPYDMVSSQRNSRKKRSSHELRQIAVENHLSCKCQCKVRPKDCDSERQYHHESTCQCKCKDDFTSSRLNCADPFRYDKDTCSCKCSYEHKHCPVAKQQWDNKLCKCTCDSGIRCPMGQVINKNSCECEDIQMSDKVPLCKKSNTC